MAEERQNKDRWLDAVTHMIALTQQRKLEWRPAFLVELPRHDDRVSAVLISEFNDRKLRLYSRRVELPKPDPFTEAIYESRHQTAPRSALAIELEFIDDKGASLWNFPSVAALKDLLLAAQYQSAGVKDFLAEIEALAS